MLLQIVFSFIRLWVREIIKSVLFIKLFNFLIPLSSQTYLLCILVWHIKGLYSDGMVLWYPVVSGVLRVLSLDQPHILGLGRILLLYILCLVVFCQFVVILFDVLYPSILLHFCKWDSLVPIHITLVLVQVPQGLVDYGSLGSILTGSLGFMVVTVLLVGGMGQSFCDTLGNSGFQVNWCHLGN